MLLHRGLKCLSTLWRRSNWALLWIELHWIFAFIEFCHWRIFPLSWPQIVLLFTGPAVYQIEQSGNTDACMDVDPDSEAGSGLAQDVCVNQFTQRQEFEYKVVPKMVPGCKKDNRNAVAVTIKSLANPPSNLCLSAPKMPGARATTAICNERDDNQLFFINVPSIRRR